MEEPGAAAGGREDHHVAVPRLGGGEDGGECGVSVAATPEPVDGFGVGKEAHGALGRGLSTEEEEDKGGDLAVGLVDPVEAVSASFEGRRCQMSVEKGCSSEERPVDVEKEKVGSLVFAPQESAEPGSLRTCHVANGRLSDKTLCVPCGRAVCSGDVGRPYDTLDKATEGRQCKREGLAGNRGGCSGFVEVKTSIQDLQMACQEAYRDNGGLSDSLKHVSEQHPCGLDDMRSVTDANNELQQDDLHEDSVPSVSGRIDVLLDGNAVRCGQTLVDSATCHVDDGGLWNKGLYAPVGEGSQSIDAGHTYDTEDIATEGTPCQQDSLVGDRGVLGGGADVKTSLDLVKPDIERFAYGMGVRCFKKDGNHVLEKDGLLLKIGAEDSQTLHEDSVPSNSGSNISVSSDGKPGWIAETSGHKESMENVIFVSQGDTLSCENGFWKQDPGSNSRREVDTCEEELQTSWMEATDDNGGLSDCANCHTEKLRCGAEGRTLTTGANHELEKGDFLPNIYAAVSRTLNEASIPSIYRSSIDVPLDGKVGRVGDISENSTCVEKLARDSLGGDMVLSENGLQMEAYADENQHSCMDVSNRLNLSVCEEASTESLKSCGPCAQKVVQHISQKYLAPELSAERDMRCSMYNQSCGDEPCCSGRGSTALCLDYQQSALGRSGPLDHLAQEFNACNSGEDKPCPVDFVSNANDGESQSQNLAPLCVFRRRNPKRAASSRSLNSEKPDQINRASSGTRKPKKVNIVNSLHQSNMNMFANKITKGRSGMHRPQKYSAWGSIQKLLDGFCQSYEPLTSNSHPTYLEKGRSNKRSDQKNQPSIRRSRSSKSSKSNCSILSDIGHLADELNGKPAFSVIADTDASSESCGEDDPKLASHKSECTDGANTQQLERDLVSSTQEKCPKYIDEERAKLSTSEPSLNNAHGTVMIHVGFSPDSVLEVASVTCESNASANHDAMVRENSSDASALNGGGNHPSVLSTSDSGKVQAPSLMHLEQQAKTAVGSENTRMEETGPSHTIVGNDVGRGKVQTLHKSNTVRKNSIITKPGCQKKDGAKGKNLKTESSTQISSCEASKLRAFSNDASVSPDRSELLLLTGNQELGSCFEVQAYASQDLGMHEHSNMHSHSITDSDKGRAFHTMKSPRHKKKDANAGKKGKVRDPHTNEKGKKKNIADGALLDHGLFNLPSSEVAASYMNEQSNLSPATELAFKNSGTVSADLSGNVAFKLDEASVPPPLRAAWVCCDDCQKWRCIPAELADVIGETNCRWTCKDNGDKAFADCSIPQEKTNAEINAELELSDASADEADNDKAFRAPSWTHIRSNLFLHRNRRTQSIDESMVCNCKPPQDGRMGCRDGCLNRMLNIECVKRTCPCGEQCSNQQFQRRNYAKLKWFQSGKKGYGLQLKEDVYEGRFLIEYVGEVLDIMSYESRQRYYASKGQKHFYFMALNGGEVIDACTKGNLGRFINHSCSPNCRTEKWMVNGEVCIGIFAMRNIKKGEELTFDYNYVRVSGAAPQKCFCGTAKCRGYIGGDISVVDTITQDDAEAGHFEQMVVDKDSERLMGSDVPGSHGSHPDTAESDFPIEGEDVHDCPAANAGLEPLQQPGGTLFDTSEPGSSLEAWSPQEDEDAIRTPVHVSRSIESSLHDFRVHDTQSSDCLQKAPNTLEGSKAPNVINGLTPSSDFRRNVVPGFSANKRNNLKQHRNVKLSSSSPIDNEHILGVEGRLNNLLDGGGGISKRKDATNGYLKLLLVTAAEGDSAGGTSKSVRDLSLILDALLKTKSHAVLLDIVNKNGLQMLHNILKQNRSNFIRTPIIRKLLKVLEFLVQKGILTSEHLNGGPRCAGVESFRDLMLSLTRHSDSQVQQFARSFRDQWFPRNVARSELTEYPRASTSAQDLRRNNTVWNSARRKRKSRWDYQPDEHYKMVGLKIQKAFSGHGESNVQISLMRNKLLGNQGTNSYHNNVPGVESSRESADDEAPPGFESQPERRPVQASFGCEVAPGLCMERYQPSLTISYGIPVAIVQHFGTPEVEGQCHQKWKVAPGVPFSPFPPLPPYPRGSSFPSTSSSQMSQHDGTPTVKHNSSGYCGRTADRDGRVHRSWRNGPRARWPFQGRRFPSNHHRFERFHPSRPQ